MKYVMERRSGEVTLIHLTERERLCSIQRFGLLPSYYGDLPVGENDGAGIYAIRPKWKVIRAVMDGFGPVLDSDIYALQFTYNGVYYECVGAEPDEEDLEEGITGKEHIGYIVIPYDKVHPICIPWTDIQRVVSFPVLRSEFVNKRRDFEK